MKIIFCLFFVALILSIWIVPIRLTIFHPILTLKYFCIDFYRFLKFKLWRNYKTGLFNAYDAYFGCVFGSGKTLSGLHQVVNDYKKYNDLLVFDIHRKKWVTQKIHILTNITLNSLPYEKLVNLGQIVSCCERFQKMDIKNDTLTCILVFIDEAQNQLHCRSFKDNLSPMMLKSLTECRHYNMSVIYDCPRFSQVDLLLRQCTSLNIKNRKIWRWQCQKVFDAFDVENCVNTNNLKPLRRTGFFIENSLYDEYNTKEIINNLIKAKNEGDLLSDIEILNLQCNNPDNLQAVGNLSGRGKKLLKG